MDKRNEPQNIDSGPSRLYRYFSVDRAKTLLADGKLFFPSASDFNDPFECDPIFNFQASKRARTQYNLKLLREKAPAMPRRDRKRLAMKAANSKSFDEAARRLIERLKGKVGILSLCERHDNLLMWAHYAASHTGICVELRRDWPPLNFALKVAYSREYPQVDFFEIADAIEGSGPAAQSAQKKWVDAIFLTKSIDWGYEQEWRILDTTGGRGKQGFNPELITKLFLGCKLTTADEKRVREWIAQGPTSPHLFRAIREQESFGLRFEQI
jgi:DUF2971 family protein